MDTSKDLVALLKNLSEGINKNDFDDYNESQVSQQFVIPILEKLGWNIKNAKEVYPQFETGDGKRVDYVLLSNGQPKVIIEVKNISTDLDDAVEKQILTYARLIDDENNSSPFICFATNGGRWKVYAYDPDKYNIDFFEEISIDKLNKSTNKKFSLYLGKGEIDKSLDNLKKNKGEDIDKTESESQIEKTWNSLFFDNFIHKEIAKIVNKRITDNEGYSLDNDFIASLIQNKLNPIKPKDEDIKYQSKFKGSNILIKKLLGNKVSVSCGMYKEKYKSYTAAAKDLLEDVIKVYGDEIIEKYIAEREKDKKKRTTYISKSQKELGDTTDSIWKINNGKKDAIQWFVNFDLGRKQIKESILEPILKLINKEVRYYEG